MGEIKMVECPEIKIKCSKSKRGCLGGHSNLLIGQMKYRLKVLDFINMKLFGDLYKSSFRGMVLL